MVLLFLIVAVLAPTACVLWFMNEAARNQSDAARQHITEAYRGQLRLLREGVDTFWQQRAAELADASAGSPEDFRKLVVSGLADSVVYFDGDGSLVYPLPGNGRGADPANDPLKDRADWREAQTAEDRGSKGTPAAYARIARSATDANTAARAAQAQIRWLVQHGEKEPALQAIQENFVKGLAASGTDLQGRSIAADELRLALQLASPRDHRYRAAMDRLVALLNGYGRPAIPSAQRLFLMDEVRAISPDVRFPTYAAERLAAQFVDEDGARSNASTLQPSRVADVWKFSAQGGRVIALYRTATVVAAAHQVLAEKNASEQADFTLVPPGAASGEAAVMASPLLPGWQLSLSLLDTKPLEEAARRRTATYIWAGYLAIAVLAVTGLFLWQAFRSQLRLARLKTDLVAAVSHELKTPLASMRLLVDCLLDDAELDVKKTRDYLQLISGENARLSRLIDNFLTFARIERNRQRFEFSEIHPSEVVQAAVAAMRERIQMASPLEVEIGSDLPALHADGDALVTVLLNLLDNAYKYTPGEKRISLHAYRADGQVIFEVEDNGIGIPAREHKRIFRRFHQVDQRLARETGGCGLGLSIVEFIVRAHGGAVRVQSEIGAGSKFLVSLPTVEPAGGAGVASA